MTDTDANNKPAIDLDKAMDDGLKNIPPAFAETVRRHFYQSLNRLIEATTSTADAI